MFPEINLVYKQGFEKNQDNAIIITNEDMTKTVRKRF